jgi:hypothetical protein
VIKIHDSFTVKISVFGIPIEVVVQREQSTKAVPQVLITCADYLIVSGEIADICFKPQVLMLPG